MKPPSDLQAELAALLEKCGIDAFELKHAYHNGREYDRPDRSEPLPLPELVAAGEEWIRAMGKVDTYLKAVQWHLGFLSDAPILFVLDKCVYHEAELLTARKLALLDAIPKVLEASDAE